MTAQELWKRYFVETEKQAGKKQKKETKTRASKVVSDIRSPYFTPFWPLFRTREPFFLYQIQHPAPYGCRTEVRHHRFCRIIRAMVPSLLYWSSNAQRNISESRRPAGLSALNSRTRARRLSSPSTQYHRNLFRRTSRLSFAFSRKRGAFS